MILKRTLRFALLFAASILSLSANAQILLSGTGDGGFQTGAATFPASGWTVVNDATNKWWVGTVYAPVGTRGAHVSQQAAGNNNNYNKNNIQVSHFYRQVTFPANATNMVLTFKWRCAGESDWDFIRVSLSPGTTVPQAGVELPIGQMIFDNLADDVGTATHQETYNIPAGFAGTTRTLVFSWINDDLFGSNPGGGVDDINITYTPAAGCTGTPNQGTIAATGGVTTFCGSATTTLTLGGASTGTGISYQWQYFDGTIWQPTGTNATTLAVSNLAATRQYRVITTCSNTPASATATPVTITVNPSPTVSVSPAETYLCSSTGDVTLTASGTGTSYAWSPAAGLNTTSGATVIATPGSSKSYIVTATLGPCTATALAAIHVTPPPALTTTATPSSVCSGSDAQLATTQFTSGNYQVYSIAPYTLTPSTTTVAFSNTVPPAVGDEDDGRSAPIALPFTFSFFGAQPTQIYLGTNGFAAFSNPGAIADAYDAQNLPDNTNPNNVIALFWHDIDFTDAGTCSYGTFGTAPNRKFVITYTGAETLGEPGSNNSGQIILHETTNYIDVIVQSSSYADTKTLGIESSGVGMVGVTPAGRNAATWTVSSGNPEAYRFAITDYTYAWTPPANLSSTSIYNPVATNLTADVTYNVGVTNSVTGCVSSGSAAIVVNPLPTASISGGASPICEGSTSTITFTGTPGATVTYNINGGAPQTVLLDAGGSNVLTTAPLSVNSTFNLVSVTSAENCTETATGSATININPRPTAEMVGTQSACEGNPGYIQVNTFAGTGPWTITYTDNNSNTFTEVVNGSTLIEVYPTVTTTYNITGLQDANCTAIAGDWSGTATVNVNPRPTGSLSSSAPAVCEGDNVTLTVTMTGTPPFTFEINDGTTNTPYSGIMTNTYDIVVSPTVATTYTLNFVQDANCFSQPADIGAPLTLNYNVRPTATISGDNTICNGDITPLTVTLTGTGPWSVEYNDGTTNTTVPVTTSPFDINVTPSADAYYTLVSVSDVNCSATLAGMTGDATVIVNQLPTITAQPTDETRCIGDFATFTASATGTGITYQWMENGAPLTNNTVYSGVDGQTLTISDLTGLDGNTYELVVTGTCSPAATSTAATLTVNATNTWTGNVNTLWSEIGNWGCGILPNEHTDVIIPSPLTNMPDIDIPTAICKSLNVSAGADVEFIGAGNALEVKEDIFANGTLDGSLGKVILSGTGAQTIPGVTYGSVDIEGGSNKTFGSNAVITGNLNLTSGYILLWDNNLTLSENATVSNASAASFVITNGLGVVVKENMGTGANTGAVLFPVGSSAASYTPMSIANNGAADNINVRVIDGVWDTYNVETPNGTMQTENAVDKTWFINEDVPGGSDATVTPQWNMSDELPLFNNANCQVAHYNIVTNEWEDSPMNPATGSGPYTQTRTGVVSFSPFGVGSENSPLPIGLVSFKGQMLTDDVKLQWNTAYEYNMKNYEIERSADNGKTFSSIATEKMKGNNGNSINEYVHVDVNVRSLNSDKLLYRLKMNGNNGKYKYSNVVTIHVGSKIKKGMIDAYPNPVTANELFVRLAEGGDENISISVTDVQGKVMSTTIYKAGEYKADAIPVDVSQLAQGMYMLRVVGFDNNTIDVLKFNRQ